MQIPVSNILNVEPNNYQGLTKTTFQSSAANGQAVYAFHQPQNALQPGQVLEGTIAADRAGKLKFTKTPNPQYQGNSQGNFQQQGTNSSTLSQPNYSASNPASNIGTDDPRQDSIEKQAYFKAAIELFSVYQQYKSQDETLDDFGRKLVQLALQIKRQMKDNANGDIVPHDVDALEQLTDIFGPGTAQVLDEGPNGL